MDTSPPLLSFRLLRLACFAAIVGLCLMGTFAKRGYFDLRRMSEKNQELGTKIEAARNQHERDLRQCEAIETRPAAQERLIRQVLGYVRPNETVIEFQ